MMDLLQAHPEIKLVVAANDYIAIGAARAAEALGRTDVMHLRQRRRHHRAWRISRPAAGTATVNTTPFVMGQMALQVTMDCLNKVYPGGWVETPTVIVDSPNVARFSVPSGEPVPGAVEDVRLPAV